MSHEEPESREEARTPEAGIEPGAADPDSAPEAEGPGARPAWGRRLAVAAAVLLAALAWIGVRSLRQPAAQGVPPDARPADASGGAGPEATGRTPGVVSVTMSEVVLSPSAKIQAEKFMCVCGCGMVLAECTCQQTPGSVDMKQHLQSLVSRGLSPSEIETGMVEKYGSGVLP